MINLQEKKSYKVPKIVKLGTIIDYTKAKETGKGNDGSGLPHAHKIRS